MSDAPDWKTRIPDPVKLAAVEVFDEVPARIESAETFDGPVVVRLDAIVGTVRIEFPGMDSLAGPLKQLMADRVRQRGRRVQNRTHEARLAFFKNTANGQVEGVRFDGELTSTDLPPNWMSSAARAFEQVEALSEADLGN